MMKQSAVITFAIIVATLVATPADAVKTEYEVGAFYHDVNGNANDRQGERFKFLVSSEHRRLPLALQVELVHEERGHEDGKFGVATTWVDLSKHVFAVVSVAGSHGASYFPDFRGDVEFHFKVPRHERLIFFGGLGHARFDTSEIGIWSLGTTYYFDRGNASYRYWHFDSDATKPGAFDSDGSSHQLHVAVGDERKEGTFDVNLLYGADVLRDFDVSGGDLSVNSRVAQLGWRRFWTEHFGTFIQAEWAEREDLFTRRGGEFRLVWKQ